jgi:hypothetical protein
MRQGLPELLTLALDHRADGCTAQAPLEARLKTHVNLRPTPFPIRMLVLGITMPIDFESRASLHKGVGQPATTGRLKYLVRHFMLMPSTERRSYTIAVGETTYRPAEIEALFKQLGHSDEAVRQGAQRRPPGIINRSGQGSRRRTGP